MGSVTDKAKGLANQAGGKVKESVGKAIGNEQMQVEGLAQQTPTAIAGALFFCDWAIS